MSDKKDKINNKYSFELTTGSPIAIKDVCNVYSLTLKEIGAMGYKRYQSLIGLLTMSREALAKNKDINLDDVTAYDIIAATSTVDQSFRASIEEALSIFLNEPVTFFADGAVFVIGTMEEVKDKSNKLRLIDRDIYGEIAKIIRLQNLMKPEVIEKKKTYVSEKARQLAEKRERGRKMMAEARGTKGTTIESLISMAGVFTKDIDKVMNWTVYQLHSQCEGFINKEQYESKFQQILAGADPKKVGLNKHWSEE